MDALDRIKNGEDCFKVLSDEVKKLLEIETSCYVEELIYCSDIGKMVVHNIDAYEQVRRARTEKKIIDLARVKSKNYCFQIDKIISYNDAFDPINKKHKKNYYDYKVEIKKLFEENNKDGLLEEFLNSKYILLHVEYHVNNKLKDLDNISKLFIDFLFAALPEDRRDNKVKKLYLETVEGCNKKEEIWFNITVLNQADIDITRLKPII